MKLSSRKKLLAEADIELNKIRVSLREDDTQEKSEKLDWFQSLVFKTTGYLLEKGKVEQIQSIDDALENLRKKMEFAQDLYDQGKPFADLTRMEKNIKAFELKFKRSPWGPWDWLLVKTGWLISFLPDAVYSDDEGNFFDKETGKNIELKNQSQPGLNPETTNSIRAIIRALTL